MAKYQDTKTLGKSNLCPFIQGEDSKGRHSRRKGFNMEHVKKVDEICQAKGLKLKVKNGGHHWQVSGGGKLLDWWPSTAKLVFDLNFKKGIHCHDYKQFIEKIKGHFK